MLLAPGHAPGHDAGEAKGDGRVQHGAALLVCGFRGQKHGGGGGGGERKKRRNTKTAPPKQLVGCAVGFIHTRACGKLIKTAETVQFLSFLSIGWNPRFCPQRGSERQQTPRTVGRRMDASDATQVLDRLYRAQTHLGNRVHLALEKAPKRTCKSQNGCVCPSKTQVVPFGVPILKKKDTPKWPCGLVLTGLVWPRLQ